MPQSLHTAESGKGWQVWRPNQPVNPLRRATLWDEAAGWPASLAWIYEFLSAGPTGHVPYMSVRLLSHLIIAEILFIFLFFSHRNFCSSIILSGRAHGLMTL